jgi:hypothetical protein
MLARRRIDGGVLTAVNFDANGRDSGSVEAIVSLEDELFRPFLSGVFGFVVHSFAGSKHGDLLRWWAQYRAERQHARTRLDWRNNSPLPAPANRRD